VIPDARLNAVTLIGEPRQVEIASSLLTQLDLRRRQVAVNVRIVDVNLTGIDNFNSSFQFGIGNDVFINFAPGRSPSFGTVRGPGGNVGINNRPAGANNDLVANLLAQIESNNAKILTDPTLVIQEGQTAQVNLTQEIIGNIERTTTVTENVADVTVTAEKEEVGVILNVNVDRIDDNGFVTLRVIPQVTSVAQNVPLVTGADENAITLRNIRQLDSGLVRLRDNQTLILTGIIQDQNITQSAKVPFLGDIPILGALFRSTQRVNQRSEVIVLLTPQILDDSQNASFGYNYTPSPDAREVLERRNFPSPEGR
jgi:type IV pilus assembly protein PilQ